MKNYLEDRLGITKGDITQFPGDAVVNAANSQLLGGGGVDGAIHRAGGSAILEECRQIRRDRYPEGLPPGKAVSTTGGNLPCRRVIHTVGPIWRGGTHGEKEILASAYRSSLLTALEEGLETVAFPAISTGIYGFPKELAAPIIYKVMKEHFETHDLPRRVDLVFFSDRDAQIAIDAFDKVYPL